MRVIVLASQKGGSGKTTLAGHLAVQAELTGSGPVAVIDTDPQGSLAKWWNAREAETPAFVAASFDNLRSDLDALRAQGFKLVFIDTPPAVTRAISHVVSHADLVVMPTRPSPHDLRAVGATVEIAAAHNKAMVFVINAATARAKITAEAAVALSQHGTVAPVMLNHRVDFAASMTDGRTVMEYSAKCASAKEIGGLWEYLSGRLARLDGNLLEYRDPAGFDFAPPPPVESPSGPAFLQAPEPAPAEAGAVIGEQTGASVEAVSTPSDSDLPLPAFTESVEAAETADFIAGDLPPSVPDLTPPFERGAPISGVAPAAFQADASFDLERTPPPLLENPQQALLEAVQRLRGELDYPVSLEDILHPEPASDGSLPAPVTDTAPMRRKGLTPFLNRMTGFGRRG